MQGDMDAVVTGVEFRRWANDGERVVFVEDGSATYAAAAEVCLAEIGTGSGDADYWLARAQVYATLAVAARPVR